jgi:hypothetical protein
MKWFIVWQNRIKLGCCGPMLLMLHFLDLFSYFVHFHSWFQEEEKLWGWSGCSRHDNWFWIWRDSVVRLTVRYSTLRTMEKNAGTHVCEKCFNFKFVIMENSREAINPDIHLFGELYSQTVILKKSKCFFPDICTIFQGHVSCESLFNLTKLIKYEPTNLVSIYVYKSRSMFVGMFEICLCLCTFVRGYTPLQRPTYNNVVFSFWSVLSLLLGSGKNEVLFSFWSFPRLLLKEEEVRCYFLSERPHESGTILDKSTRIAKG